MSTGYRIGDQRELHFLTLTVVGWIDVFTRREHRDIIIESLDYCRKNKGLEIFAYVIMSNHLHVIARAKETTNLSDILRDFKKYTSKAIIRAIGEEPESRREWMLSLFKMAVKENPGDAHHHFWQRGNHPVELDNIKIIDQKINYIHDNPVKAGLVENPEDYLYSSARNYAGLASVLEIEEV